METTRVRPGAMHARGHQHRKAATHEFNCNTRAPTLWRQPSARPRIGAAPASAAPEVVQAPAPPSALLPRPSYERLNDPAHIGAKGSATHSVQAYEGPVSLSSYMTLPVEQYFVLDPSQIRHLGGNRFLLFVPRINIASVWMEPEVEISVIASGQGAGNGPLKVVLQAENCRLRGSPSVEALRLDDRFCMRFVTELTWEAPPSGGSPAGVVAGRAGAGGGAGAGVAPAPIGQGRIRGDATLDVWCEVIPPFNLLPRQTLEATCNAIMHGLVSTLLPLFVRKLGADYAKWATDGEYRAERAARSKPLAA